MKCKLLTSQNVVENRSPICRPREHDSSTWGGLLLLENNCVDRDSNTDANCCHHRKSRLQRLVLHPVQVVHVLGMEVVWLIMAVPSHSLHTSGMESTRSWCMHKEMKISNQGVIKWDNEFTNSFHSKALKKESRVWRLGWCTHKYHTLSNQKWRRESSQVVLISEVQWPNQTN